MLMNNSKKTTQIKHASTNNKKKVRKKTTVTKKTKCKSWVISLLVIIVSIIAFIVGIKLLGLIKAFIVIFILDLLYFIPVTIKKQKSMDPVLRKKRNKRILKIILLIFVGGFVLVILAGIAFYLYIAHHAPNFNPEALFVSEPSVLIDINGNQYAQLGNEKRVILSYDELPEVLIDAIVATEDSKFFVHNGVDWARFLKASVQQLMGKDVGGASTLTMQISKNSYTSTEARGIKGIIRKFTDVYISTSKIEPKYLSFMLIVIF